MKLFFDPLARAELEDAIKWYENEKEGLGARFKAELDETLERIIRHPDWSIKVKGHIYKIRIKIFPYKILYALDGDSIIILAISHNHREPNYWIGRI